MTLLMRPHEALEQLHALRSRTGEMDTVGLSDEVIVRFCEHDSNLSMAISEATTRFEEIVKEFGIDTLQHKDCLLYTSPSPRDATLSRMPSSA